MIKRLCPGCGTSWYSADTTNTAWKCDNCGASIPKSAELPIDTNGFSVSELYREHRKKLENLGYVQPRPKRKNCYEISIP